MFNKLLKSSKIIIVLPDSFLENESTLFLKTLKIGILARLFSIFRINQIIFYNDNANSEDLKISQEIFKFLSLAPYLRKENKKNKYLQFSAILPPLQTPNQINYDIGDHIIKESLVLESKKLSNNTYSLLLDIGENKPLSILIHNETKQINNGTILPLKINKTNRTIEFFNISNVFWKYNIKFTEESLDVFLNHIDTTENIIIAASKYGEGFSINHYMKIKKHFEDCKSIYLLIGPTKGSFKQYLIQKAFDISKINYWINFIENQGTKTVKIEEAISSALSILNLFQNL